MDHDDLEDGDASVSGDRESTVSKRRDPGNARPVVLSAGDEWRRVQDRVQTLTDPMSRDMNQSEEDA